MNLARLDTAKTFLLGPILDADGVAKTDEVVASLKVTKNGSVGAPNGSSTLTHDHTGKYLYAANAGDIDTLGEVEFSLDSGTNAMAPLKFQVVPANVYDSLVLGSDDLVVDAEDSTWDAILTGATHNIPTSAGRRLRGIQEFQGYAGGMIWIDTLNGTAGTTDFENGTVENPVLTWADALILAASLKMFSFHISNGSTITLTANSDNYTFMGGEWTLLLNGQSCSDAVFIGAHVTGTCTGVVVVFRDCQLAFGGGSLVVAGMEAHDCGIAGDITLTAANTYSLDQCYSGVAGVATPSLDFGAAVGTTNLNFRHYSGGIEIKNIGRVGTDKMSLEGFGQLVLNANCLGGTIAMRGHFTVTDNAGDVVALSDDARYDVDQINAQADLALTDYGASTHNAGDVLAAFEAAVTYLKILAFASGKVVITGSDLQFFDADGTTPRQKITPTSGGRTVT